MAVRYRDLQRPSLVDVTPLETGNSEAAATLARAFKQFEGIATEGLGKLRAQQGQQEGAAAGASGTPEFRAGLRAVTAYGQAYNNAALRSYAVKMEGDAEEHAARLEVEAQNDPEKFNTLFGAVRDESIKQAPKEARAALSEIYATRLNAGVSRLTRARATEQLNLARSDTAEGVERAVDRIANLLASGDDLSIAPGQMEQGNIDIHSRPVVQNKDGSVSTVRTISFGTDKGEILIPTVSDDGRIMSDEEAIQNFRRTGKHLGVFDSPINATAYARRLHDQQDTEYLQAVEEQEKLNLLIDGAVRDGTLSAAEGVTLHKNSQRQLVAQTVTARFQRQLQSPYGNPVDFIQRLKAENIKSEALSPKEEEQLVDQLMADLREHNFLTSQGLAESSALVKARYEAGDRDATAALFSGELTVGKLRQMVLDQRLDPGRATSLANELASGGVAADDPKEAFHVRTNLLDIPDDEIASNRKLSYKTRGDLILKKREEQQTWKGTQAAQEGKERIERALGIVPGTNRAMLSNAELEALDQAKTSWYSQVDALPAGERQAAVIRIAEETAGTYIRKNKAVQVQEGRRNLEAYIQRSGDPTKMGKEERKQFEAIVARRKANIDAMEAEAARK